MTPSKILNTLDNDEELSELDDKILSEESNYARQDELEMKSLA